MYGQSDPQQQWTVHAEFTIKHDGLDDRIVHPETHTERDENGIHMVYTWSGQYQNPSQCNDNSAMKPGPSSPLTTHEKNIKDPQLPYGFQRGNLVFTSTPPSKNRNMGFNVNDSRNLGTNVPDSSGYSSEMLSPNSGSLPYRPIQPYNRRCKSTCSIVLSTDFNHPPDEKYDAQSQCGRTQSLRCQTPTTKSDRKDSFYGCGDPWCYHGNYTDNSSSRFPPLQECDENATNSTRLSRASTYNSARSDKVRSSAPKPRSKLRDACVQTFEMIDKCTSPFMRTDYSLKDSDSDAKRGKSFGKRATYNSRRKTEPLYQRRHSPSSFTPDSLESQQTAKRSIRVPTKHGPQVVPEIKAGTPDSRSSDPNKKPRTIHIDVYCTGTEQESSTSSDSENKTSSSPLTVFESGKFKLTHKKADNTELPYNLQKNTSGERTSTVKELKKNFEKDDSDDDGASTAYPSQLSSFSAIKDFASSFSSVPPSLSTVSMSSYAIPDDDSVANTSWKDTYSDLASLLESRSSIAQTDSLDFVPRKLLACDSIEEYPEVPKNLTETSSKASLQPSDSFEYANSEDRFRIKEMEHMWEKGKQWKSPHLERKHLLQQRKLKEYLDKRSSENSLPKWDGKESDSEGTDSEEKGWSFVNTDIKLVRDDTVKSTCKDGVIESKTDGSAKKSEPKITVTKPKQQEDKVSQGPAPKSPGGKQRFSLDPNVRSPFTILPGIFTEQREVAERFGHIVDRFKKPGHHVGPAKNPDCTCEHCRRHFEIFGMRNRAQSWGDSTTSTINWKNAFRGSVPRDTVTEANEPVQSMTNKGYTDF